MSLKKRKFYIFTPRDPQRATSVVYVQNFLDGRRRAAKGDYQYAATREDRSPLEAARAYLGPKILVTKLAQVYKDPDESWKVGHEATFRVAPRVGDEHGSM